MSRVVTGTVVLPKEGNVAEFVEKNFAKENLEVRTTKAWSEDIPKIVERREGYVGLTGEDYMEEYNASIGRIGIAAVKLYRWYDAEYLYGFPTLCLLGPKEGNLGTIPKSLSICINSKWKNITENYIKQELEQRRRREISSILPVRGETEERYKDGGIDLVAEVVCKGNGAIAAALKPYDRIFTNRGVVAIAKKTI